MKKFFYVLSFLVLLTNLASAQDYFEPQFYLSVSSGADNNFNAFRTTTDSKGFEYYAIPKHYNISASFGVQLFKRFRPRFDFKYVAMSYGQYWPSGYPTFVKTETDLGYIDLNLYFDYLVLTYKKFDIYISPALKTEYLSSEEFTTTKSDGNTSSSHFNLLSEERPRALAGGAISSILKYNINRYVGITLTPEYTMFFRDFVKTNDKTYQRFSLNMGVEVHF
jgi:hypothetical protein